MLKLHKINAINIFSHIYAQCFTFKEIDFTNDMIYKRNLEI